MATYGRDAQQVRNELSADESGGQQLQQAQEQSLQLGEAAQQRQFQAFQGADQLRQQSTQHQQALAEETRHNKMTEATASDEQDVQMANEGLQRQGPSRADTLRAEMERGNRQKQMNQPLEVNGPQKATVAQTPERQANDQAKMQSEAFNARARYQNALRLAQQAHAKGDVEAERTAKQDAQNVLESHVAMTDRFMKLAPSDRDWTAIKDMAQGNPDPALKQEIDSKQIGPRVKQFLNSHLDAQSLHYISATGDLPNGKMVNLASPVFGQLQRVSEDVAAKLRSVDQITQGWFSLAMGIDSVEKRNNVIRKQAADSMLRAMSTGAQPSTGQPQGGGGMIPPLKGTDLDVQPSTAPVGAGKPKLGQSIYDEQGRRKPSPGLGRSIYGDSNIDEQGQRRDQPSGAGGEFGR